MATTRLNKKRAAQGIDGINLEYTIELNGMENLYLPKKDFKDEANNAIVEIDCVGGKVRAYINPVHVIRPNNIKSFGLSDIIKLELVRNTAIEDMRSYLKEQLQDKYSDEFVSNLKVTSAECNITAQTVGGASPSDVIHLIDQVLDKTVVFRKRKASSKCDKVSTACLYSKPKEYRLKIYDKSEEQHEHGNPLVEDNLLRIEVVFIDRSLKRMYGDKRTIGDVLTKQGLEVMCLEYKRVLIEDIINRHIRTYLSSCKKQLVESLTNATKDKICNEISYTVMRNKECICDWAVFRSALRSWYSMRGVEDYSRQIISLYRKKGLGIPDGVLKTIKLFHQLAG